MNARPSAPSPSVERDDGAPNAPKGGRRNGSGRPAISPALPPIPGQTPPVPRQTMRAPRVMGGKARRRAIVYDDQARRFGRKGPAPSPVEVRRVRRVVRRVDPWSLFRFAFVLYTCAVVVFLAGAVALWLVAQSAGAIPSIEHFITQLFVLKNFTLKPRDLFLGALGLGVVWALAATLFTVIAAVLYNLISDVVGGIELTMLEEHPVEIATESR
jgi:hypothetical protein